MVLFVVPMMSTAALASDAPDPVAAPTDRVEEHELLRWIQVHEPEHYAMLSEHVPEVLEAYRQGTEDSLIDQLDPHDPFAALAGLSSAAQPQEGFETMFGDSLPGSSAQVQAGSAPAASGRASSDAASPTALPAPSNSYRKFIPTCDTDGNGVVDAVSLHFQPPPSFNFWPLRSWPPGVPTEWGRSELRGINGTTGETEWIAPNGIYMPMMIPTFGDLRRGDPGNFYWAPHRFGTPNPDYNLWQGHINGPPDVMKVVPDANGDGACDVAAFGFGFSWPWTQMVCSLLGVCIVELYGTLRVHDSTDGSVIWEKRIDSHYQAIKSVSSEIYYETYEFKNYPTGWEVFESPSGPKIAWKTTDVNYTEDPSGAHFFRVREEYQIFNSTNGEELKRTVVEHPPHPQQMVTWLTGVADLGGDEEFEIIYDQKLHPIEGGASPSNPAVGALRGDLQPTDASNQHLWEPQGFYTPPQTGTGDAIPGNFEGAQEVFFWHHAVVNGDITGDGVDDVIPTYFTGPPPGKFAVNQDFKTHVAPIDGASGELVWGANTLDGELLDDAQDVKLQGWGYARALEAANGTGTTLVLGTSDVPTQPTPGSRFPLKENFVTVYDGKDGRPIVNHRAPYGTDSFISFDLAVAHSRDNLGTVDWNGDGTPDVMTPAIAVPVSSATQRLLSTMEHEYRILDGQTGDAIASIHAWGGIGTPLSCADEETVTVASGYGRRVDLTRFDVHTGEVLWRQPFFNNPMPPAMSVGTELIFLAGDCAINTDGGATAGLILGLNSLLRRYEVMPPMGRAQADSEAAWMQPGLAGDPAVEPSIDFFVVEPLDLSAKQSMSWAGTASIGGAMLGAVFSVWRARRWGL